MVNEAHTEFLIRPMQHGITLVKPDAVSLAEAASLQSVGQMLATQLHVYFLDNESKIKAINQETIKNCGFPSVKQVLNKTVHLAAKSAAAEFSIQHDQQVLTTRRRLIREENFQKLSDDLQFFAVTIKCPWYTEQGDVAGIFGYSFVPSIHGISSSLEKMMDLQLFSFNDVPKQMNPLCLYASNHSLGLTTQEIACLKFLLRGYTAKMIAKQLNRSPRTVEHYLEDMKRKFGVNSKYELINRAYELGFPSLLT